LRCWESALARRTAPNVPRRGALTVRRKPRSVFRKPHASESIWALELLPAYDAVARVKVGGHCQSDVLAGFLLGTGTGVLAYRRDSPFILESLPRGFMIGYKARF
jgi:hypothetical protein